MECRSSPSEAYRRHQWGQLIGMLPKVGLSKQDRQTAIIHPGTNHARAGEGIPAQSNAIALLNIAPLVLQRLKVHAAG